MPVLLVSLAGCRSDEVQDTRPTSPTELLQPEGLDSLETLEDLLPGQIEGYLTTDRGNVSDDLAIATYNKEDAPDVTGQITVSLWPDATEAKEALRSERNASCPDEQSDITLSGYRVLTGIRSAPETAFCAGITDKNVEIIAEATLANVNGTGGKDIAKLEGLTLLKAAIEMFEAAKEASGSDS